MALIPRRILFGNPQRAFALISPNGRQLASLAPVDGVMNIVVAPIDAPDSEQPLTSARGRGIGHCVWAYDNESLLYLADHDGDENWHLYRLRLADAAVTDLTPGAGVRARLLELSPRHPDAALVEIQSPDAEACGLFRIRLADATREALPPLPDFQRLLTDDFRPVLGSRPRADGGSDWYQPGADVSAEWNPAFSVPPEDNLTTYPVGLAGDQLYLVDSRGRDRAALVQQSLTDGRQQLLFEPAEADVSDVLLDARGRQPLAVAVTGRRKQWHALDAGVAAEFDYLAGRAHGDISIASRSADDHHWIIGYQADTAPVNFYHYDRRRGTARYLFNNSDSLAAQPLAAMHTATLAAHDGLPLHVYYTQPPAAEGPGPTLLLVHGGPWARDEWGFNPWHQWLANRGYTVLSVNYRGSAGYGKAFLNAGDREWGRAMQQDLHDCVDWAVAQGLSDPARIALMGTSYGGYATLAGLAFTPTRFACGIDLMGPSHLPSLLAAIPPQWQAQRDFFRQRLGDPDTEAGRALLEARSPLGQAHNIRRPLLIAQGAHDPRVPRSESDRLVETLRAHDIPVIYLLFPDEGHGIARPANRLALCTIAEAFLARCLGGAMEPAAGEFDDSAVEVLAGAELLADYPGLAELHRRTQ
ncbi:dipeptidyl aminopeptidase/acylaminoacyl peptidase [Methylohalomonas lacus]|uniref:Dipeptidyl aminopeptidase/acylaminoacyl peptidase n=1 Tax=Methylohalomonas lacus TaxID=398773 RepID=A0AAE3L0Q3_9GAMM|nr:alpha/beta fold hydrolase [Methylohalomonas lacus]MCS3902919.1 dipeptidyl aminopeptidase/acylaminoacyl peptidase [Methylohalomonas lacus]